MENQKIYGMPFAKVERKGRSKEEVYEVTEWLTGFIAIDIGAQLFLT